MPHDVPERAGDDDICGFSVFTNSEVVNILYTQRLSGVHQRNRKTNVLDHIDKYEFKGVLIMVYNGL